ncbi:MAG: aminotransferase class V-fold PLP-dependent enzyme [Leadbetterella sp.]|nr:aminotransferase class V-fold PLP-dependent enzyme [Leadbetterella sp.]
MINFYPGPSKVYDRLKDFSKEAFESGILEQNHRSQPFMDLLQETISLLKKHLNMPENYKVYFTSSATECWEICAQSLIRGKVQFLYNGAFGKKWFKYTVTNPQINSTTNYELPTIRGTRFFINQKVEEVEIDPENDVVCWVSSETSNGTHTSFESIKKLKEKSPKALLVVDATSSLGGENYDIADADVWFSSSQKCFGMPSGLGVMIVSPLALERAIEINERNHYNSLIFIEENFKKFQTHYTPNILGIYLFKRLLETLPNINYVSEKLNKRSDRIIDFFENSEYFDLLVENPDTRSKTVVAIVPRDMEIAIKFFKENEVIIGKGYGEWKNNTLRIANFPAIPDEDFEELFRLLENYV